MKENTQKITPEVVRNSQLVFYPKTTEEAVHLQQKLFAMGAIWGGNASQQTQYVQQTVAQGLSATNGTLYYGVDVANPGNMVATLQQVDPGYLTPEQSFQQELFNKLSAKIDALAGRLEQVSAKVDKVHDEMFPAVSATKPKLKPAGQGA